MNPAVPMRQDVDQTVAHPNPSRQHPAPAGSNRSPSEAPGRGSFRIAASRGEAALFVASTAAFAAYLAWLGLGAAVHPDNTTGVPMVSQGVLALLSVFAAMLATSSAMRPGFDRATRRAWLFFAIAQTATAFVSASWVYRLASGSRLAGPATVQIVAGLYYLSMLWALMTFPVRRLKTPDRTTFWLDSALVASAAAVLTWHLLLRAALVAAGSDWRTAMYALAYPVGDVVLLFAAIALLLRRPLPGSVRAIRILAVSILLNAAADILFMWAYIAKESQGERFVYLVLATIAWMAAASAFSQLRNRRLRASPYSDASREPRRDRPSLIPNVAVVAIYATLLIEVYRTELGPANAIHQAGGHFSLAAQFPITTLVAGAIIVTAIVIARQLAAQRKNAELAAERLAREAHFRALVQHSSDMVLVLLADGVVREASPAVERVLGHPPERVVGRPFWDFFAQDDQDLVRADIAQAIAAGDGDATASGPCEWRIRDAHGRERWVEAICTNLIGDAVVGGLVINGRDVSERKQLEAELTHRAYHDSLTGLVNRTRFRAKVIDAINRTCASPRASDGRNGLAILYIDLDGFKAVNDIFGHDAGDIVLSAVADRLRDATRGSDTAARLGGDEFAILLERLRDEEEVKMVASRVLQLVHTPVTIDRREVTVGASIGIVCAALGDADGQTATSLDPDALLRNADRAMYAAKARGRGNYEFFASDPGGIV